MHDLTPYESGEYYMGPDGVFYCLGYLPRLGPPAHWGPSISGPLDWKARVLAFFGIYLGPQ